MKMKTNKVGLGISLEKFIYSVLKSFKKPDYDISHVDWKKYNKGFGLDVWLTNRKTKETIGIECKNWRLFNKPYGTKTAKSEIISRFLDYETEHGKLLKLKILIISFKELLTKKAIKLLKLHNIHIVETNKLIGKKDFRTRLFYQLKAKIERLIRKKPKTTHSLTADLFDLLFKSNKVVVNAGSNEKISSHKKQQKHDTQLIKQPISTFKQVIQHLETQIDKQKQKEKG